MQGILENSNSEFTIDCNNNGQCSNGGITGEVIPVSFNFWSGYSHSGNSIKTNGGVDYEEDYFTWVTQTQDVLDPRYEKLTLNIVALFGFNSYCSSKQGYYYGVKISSVDLVSNTIILGAVNP